MFQVKDQHFSHSKVRIQRDIWSPLVNTLGGEKKYEFSLLRFEISALSCQHDHKKYGKYRL